MKQNITHFAAKETAKQIRAELKKAFPGKKFSVRSDVFAGGDAVDVSWDNYPDCKTINAFLDNFKSGSFNGMEDIYEYGSYMYEGVRYSGAKYVHGQRNLTNDYRELVISELAKLGWSSNDGYEYSNPGYGYTETFWKLLEEVEDTLEINKPFLQVCEILRSGKLVEVPAASNAKNTDTQMDAVRAEALIKSGTVSEKEHTQTGDVLQVLTLNERLSKDEFKAFNDYLKAEKIGYYSKFAKGFILVKSIGPAAPAEKKEDYKTDLGEYIPEPEKVEAYQEKKEARIDRYNSYAAAALRRSDTRFKTAKQMASFIPFGQPILVGHHSERRDRNFRAKIQNNFHKSIEEQNKADYYQGKANAAAGNSAISSDDPEAVLKLAAKIEAAEKSQEIMKEANKAIRKKGGPDLEALKKLGLGDMQLQEILKPAFGRPGFASYSLQNNLSNIRRMKERLEELKRAFKAETKEHDFGNFKIVENTEVNRIQIVFEDIPAKEIRKMLGKHGFKWSPSNNAWQRFLNGNGRYAAKTAAVKIQELTA